MSVLTEVEAEQARQLTKWGQQNHPDGTTANLRFRAHAMRESCDRNTANGMLTWYDILTEEYAEAMCETDTQALRAELIQVAAVACSWVEAIDRRRE